MESPRQFIERFIKEQSQLEKAVKQLYRPFEEKFYEDDYRIFCDSRGQQKNNSESILTVEDFGDVAKVVTNGSRGYPKRIKYHLRRNDGTWCIEGLEWDCAFCDSAGSQLSKVCTFCHGTGWRDPLKEDNSQCL